MNSPHMDYALAPRASGPASWLETFLVTALVIGLGLWLTPQDPLQVQGEFPWSVLAPLLLGVRYGFVRGLISASLLVAAFFVLRQSGLAGYAQIAPSYVVGVLVCGMLVGEVRDLWERRLLRLQMANEYRQYRLDEFTRAHQILRVSHDRLEQRLAGSDQSLRSSLLGLRERLRAVADGDDSLTLLAEPVLTLLGQYGSLRVAGLYRVEQPRSPTPTLTLLAATGTMGPLDNRDLLVRLCLEREELVSVREELIDSGGQAAVSSLQACIPLVDIHGRMLAILAVRQMPFFAFQERTLSLLALLAGHIADLLHHDPEVLQLENVDAQHFSRQLKRSLVNVEQHGLSGCLYAFELTQPNDELAPLFERSRRGLDLHLTLINNRGNALLLVLLPLTSAEGAEGYLARLGRLIHEYFGMTSDLAGLGVKVLPYDLESARQRDGLRNFLQNECGLNVQQVAV
ncbi:sugar transporter [Pseudomonas agarici]|uniref:Sugar transporter n=1 Tax=Pseudomonas agarici TaxID=46677 RepID=A0A0X1SYX2_PSEAA|nr:PelD GGDEF domain-containing protein [Pseudomonas agarici]AMB85018.1 sugar transporter [Pseudomonas agarici]NWB93263.1 sugar transporter [Pseudomonas agarici]NWC08364.1 sugar transporter [Pseudomonas agarici]SEK64783.1 PelD GGDEF domain-containing protein [Pseudomonas agarici]